MITITHNNKAFKISMNQRERGISVAVFAKGEKSPLFGTIFSHNDSFTSVIEPWIKANIEKIGIPDEFEKSILNLK